MWIVSLCFQDVKFKARNTMQNFSKISKKTIDFWTRIPYNTDS